MKSRSILIVLSVLICAAAIAAEPEQKAALSWFSDAQIADSVRMAKPADALPEVPGSAGNGVILTKSVPVDNPLLQQKAGMISFWLKPNWNGNDGKTHVILRIGKPGVNGLIVEKSDKGILRYAMTGQGVDGKPKTTVARYDISDWKAGKWHHVSVVWFDRDGKPVGIPLWIDHVAVNGPVYGGTAFMDPSKMTDKRVWIGDASSDAVMDELLFRNWFDYYWPKENGRDKKSQLATVYRDYFATAPFTKIVIDPNASDIPSDKRVVNGCQKQFGLRCEMEGKLVRVTEQAFGYGNWTEFDAKPQITWSTSDAKVATVDADGIVTGKSLGACKLYADFRGMKSSYNVQVISIEQPDLDLSHVERLPRYSYREEKWWPNENEKVTSVAHVFNFGYKAVPAGTVVRWELIPDTNNNFRADANEKPRQVQTQTIAKELKPGESITLTFPWNWTTDQAFIKVTLDPDNKVSEICEANNERCELNYARALRWGYVKKTLDDYYDKRKINLVGSFSYYDWYNAQLYRVTKMMQEAVYPTTSPDGIRDAVRTDQFFDLAEKGDPAKIIYPGEDSTFFTEVYEYDGGFPVQEPADIMSLSCAIIHEIGHTCLALPDYYGYPTRTDNVLLKDDKGDCYAGSATLPEVPGGGSWLSGHWSLMLPSSENVECGVGYTHLMDFCHLWINPADAGQIQHFARYRGDKFWGVQGRFQPSLSNSLKIFDIDDKPLTNAAVYAYHVCHVTDGNGATKYFPDRPKFVGKTDAEGRYEFPGQTDATWDDSDTDAVDGEISVWNPYGRALTDTAFTSNVMKVEGLVLLKIVSNGEVEFHWLPQTDLLVQFFSGHTMKGVYPIHTSLRQGGAKVEKPQVPDAIAEKNLRPVAVAPAELTVKCGQEFTIDGSKSYDPEGQPLVYRWGRGGDWLREGQIGSVIFKDKAPDEPRELIYHLYVIDGLRASNAIDIKVVVEK